MFFIVFKLKKSYNQYDSKTMLKNIYGGFFMQKTRKLISMLLAVMMVLSMCTIGMFSASAALPEGAVINGVEGNDASSVDGETYGLMGDVDANGKVNVKDATQIQKSAAKIITLDETATVLADVDLNDKVNVKDATAIQKWVAKIAVDMPINCLVYFPTAETTATEEVTTAAPTVVVPTVATVDKSEPATSKVPVIVIPTTAEPTEAPTTVEPTEAPKPTEATDPTEAPTTAAKPTEAPTTAKPTEAPTTVKPTEAKPTEAPTTVKPTEAPTTVKPTEAPTTSAPATQPTTEDDGMITVYFAKPAGWADAYIYGFYGVEGETADVEWPAVYPGLAMTFVETDENGVDIYSYEAPETINYIKFTDGTGSSPNRRTTNVPSTAISDGACYTAGDETSKANQFNYTTYNYKPETETTTSAQEGTTTVEDNTTVADDGKITVYFTNNKGWAAAYIYGFYGVAGEEATGKPLGDYPGTKMTEVKTNSYGQKIYSAEVPADIDYIKFCDGNTAENHRTDNIASSEFENGTGFYLTELGEKYWGYETYEYTEGDEEDTTVTEKETTTVSKETEPTTTASATEPTTPVVKTVKITFYTAKTGWVADAGAYVNLVDTATNKEYEMTLQSDNYSWTAEVPETVTNIKFTRHNPSGGAVWNSWNAGNRGTKTIYQTSGSSTGAWNDEVAQVKKLTIYFDNSKTKWDYVAFYQWNDSSFGGWNKMTQIAGTDIWSIEINSNITEGLFKGTAEGAWEDTKQTNNITIDSAKYGNDILYTPSSTGGKWNTTASAYNG